MKLKLKPNQKQIDIPSVKSTINNRKIIFRHGRAPGDNIMFTAGVRDFCLLFPQIKVAVDKKYPWIWENNPYISNDFKKGDEGVEYYEVGYPSVGYVNNSNVHFTQMFLLDMIAMADLHSELPISVGEFCSAFANGHVGDPRMGKIKGNEVFTNLELKYSNFCKKFSRQRGDLHLSEEEKKNNLVRDVYGVEKYWVVAPGGKSDFTAKQWDWRRFQKVVDYFGDSVKFVVIGSRESQMFVENFKGTIDLNDKFNGNKVRGLVPLVYHAEGVISTPSLIMHMGAAVPKRSFCKHCRKMDYECKCINPRLQECDKPGVTIFGGREPTAWSWYCSYQILHNNAAFSCCREGGCWKSRIYPISKSSDKNSSLCELSVEVDGKTVQSCMNVISAEDVIRAIEKYYEGDLYTYDKLKENMVGSIAAVEEQGCDVKISSGANKKEINIIGNLNSKGGGEQSLIKISKLLIEAGWNVILYPARNGVHENYRNSGINIIEDASLENGGIVEHMKPGLGLFFYGNDTVGMFCSNAKHIVDKSSAVIIGINYVNNPLPNTRWLSGSGKVKAVVFQNTEKLNEWNRDEIGYLGLKKYVLFGAIELDRFLEVCPLEREKDEPLVVLRHSLGDYRKFITKLSHGKGQKRHLWEKHFERELDTKFYSRLLKSLKKVRFEFMEAHEELIDFFKGEPRMVFHKWDSMPVEEFLTRGHVWLLRSSGSWRDNFPRVHAEAMAVGLPTLVEPRDGTYERMKDFGHGNRGFLCVHYDEYELALRTLMRKEKFRREMGLRNKEWARQNLNPHEWIKIVEEVLDGF